MAAEDLRTKKFYRLTLDQIENEEHLQEIDPAQEAEAYMRRAENKTEQLDDTPEWPSHLDPFEREGLEILGGLVDVTRDARMAGMLKPSSGVR